jgi:acetolactate synthase-1/2/3 large subunit
MKIRAADYIVSLLEKKGIHDVFLVTGGGAMHLNDAFGRNKSFRYTACHHEQSCAIAAESYARMSGRLAAVNVTTGPGGTNALTGVYGAFVDSLGMVVISGQVKWETLAVSTDLPLRQLGDQEVNIVEMVKPITKYAAIIKDISELRYQIEKALYLVDSGRPGPVWIDVPMNIQGAMIDPSILRGFDPRVEAKEDALRGQLQGESLNAEVRKFVARLKSAKRPVLMAGNGIRISGAYDEFLKLINELNIPVTTAWNAHDLVWNDHPTYAGRPGSVGDRAGNFTVQNSDLLLVLGSRLNIRQISYNWKSFARHAYQVMVDIDSAELRKPTLRLDQPIHADLKDFVKALRKEVSQTQLPDFSGWVEWCKSRVLKYNVVLPEYWKTSAVNPYCFVDTLFRELPENELVVTGDGTACVVSFQASHIKRGQRLYTNSGCAAMGYDLPAALGAYKSMNPERLICITGDGSIQMNIQELQTIKHSKMNMKIFVLNNRGYHSIRQTQQNYFPDNVVGCGTESGLSFPEVTELGRIYGFQCRQIHEHEGMAEKIRETLEASGPQICEVMLDLNQQFAPKLSSRKLDDGRMISSPLEDLAPFLPRDEFAENMLIPHWEE